MTDNDKQSEVNEEKDLVLPTLVLPDNSVTDRDSTEFPDRVRLMRNKLGLTLKALSYVTKVVDPSKKGISSVSLSRYESGSEPGMRELKLLSLAFYKPISWLIYGEHNDPMHNSQHSVGNLSLLFDDLISETVNAILINKGVIEPSLAGDLLDKHLYDAMIEEVIKLSK